jgi:hypothetical protein
MLRAALTIPETFLEFEFLITWEIILNRWLSLFIVWLADPTRELLGAAVGAAAATAADEVALVVVVELMSDFRAVGALVVSMG